MDGVRFASQQPKSVDAIFMVETDSEARKESARSLHRSFLRAFGKSESEFPLLMLRPNNAEEPFAKAGEPGMEASQSHPVGLGEVTSPGVALDCSGMNALRNRDCWDRRDGDSVVGSSDVHGSPPSSTQPPPPPPPPPLGAGQRLPAMRAHNYDPNDISTSPECDERLHRHDGGVSLACKGYG